MRLLCIYGRCYMITRVYSCASCTLSQVSVLLIVLLFVFASYGVQLYGGLLARCNDETITDRHCCHGVYMRSIFITKMKVSQENKRDSYIMVPRVW